MAFNNEFTSMFGKFGAQDSKVGAFDLLTAPGLANFEIPTLIPISQSCGLPTTFPLIDQPIQQCQSDYPVAHNYPKTQMTINDLDKLCKNFMRGGCEFSGCKFYHPTPVELICYGKQIQDMYLKKYGQIEICKDYLNGCCDRQTCKYKHPDDYWLKTYSKFNTQQEVETKMIEKAKSFKLTCKPDQ